MKLLSLLVSLSAPAEVPELVVFPLGNPRRETISRVRRALEGSFRMDVRVASGGALPVAAYTRPRNRYRAEKLVAHLRRLDDGHIIGVTDRDISTTLRGHKDFGVMGFATGAACVVSSYRSKNGVGKVAIHEVGHTLGLPHCPTVRCVMQDAKGTDRIVTSTGKFCGNCAKAIGHWLR